MECITIMSLPYPFIVAMYAFLMLTFPLVRVWDGNVPALIIRASGKVVPHYYEVDEDESMPHKLEKIIQD